MLLPINLTCSRYFRTAKQPDLEGTINDRFNDTGKRRYYILKSLYLAFDLNELFHFICKKLKVLTNYLVSGQRLQ